MYRYPPLLPSPGYHLPLSQTLTRPRHAGEYPYSPPSSSSSQNSGHRIQVLDSGRSLMNCSRRASPRTSINNLKWLDYAVEVRDENGAAHYECRWEKPGRLPTICDYQAQKQAMKRHVEATHLKFKLVFRFLLHESPTDLRSSVDRINAPFAQRRTPRSETY
jgi:hypothetical protein